MCVAASPLPGGALTCGRLPHSMRPLSLSSVHPRQLTRECRVSMESVGRTAPASATPSIAAAALAPKREGKAARQISAVCARGASVSSASSRPEAAASCDASSAMRCIVRERGGGDMGERGAFNCAFTGHTSVALVLVALVLVPEAVSAEISPAL